MKRERKKIFFFQSQIFPSRSQCRKDKTRLRFLISTNPLGKANDFLDGYLKGHEETRTDIQTYI